MVLKLYVSPGIKESRLPTHSSSNDLHISSFLRCSRRTGRRYEWRNSTKHVTRIFHADLKASSHSMKITLLFRFDANIGGDISTPKPRLSQLEKFSKDRSWVGKCEFVCVPPCRCGGDEKEMKKIPIYGLFRRQPRESLIPSSFSFLQESERSWSIDTTKMQSLPDPKANIKYAIPGIRLGAES